MGDTRRPPSPDPETRWDDSHHHGSHPKSEQELGEYGSYGRTYRLTPRSDEDVWDDVGRALAECEDLDATEIDVMVEHGTVYLDGSVARPYERRLAQNLVVDVPGVKAVENRLKSRDPI